MNQKWHVEFDSRAAKELRKLDHAAQKLILNFLKEKITTELDPRRFGKALVGNLSGLWRYRIGDYRIICVIQDEKLIVLTLKIGHRRDVYHT